MNLCQKIGTLIFRLLGTLVFFYGAVYVIICVINSFTTNNPNYLRFSIDEKTGQGTFLLLTGLFFVAAGAIIYYVGKPVAKFIGKDLND